MAVAWSIPPRAILAARLPPGMYSTIMYGIPWKAPKSYTLTMLGWRSWAMAWASGRRRPTGSPSGRPARRRAALNVVAGWAGAGHQAGELRPGRHYGLERLDEVGRVVVGVHDVQVRGAGRRK